MFRRRGADVATEVDAALRSGRPSGWFEPVYAGARGRSAAVPWARGAPDPALVGWLDAPLAGPPGRRAVVVGCGLGDDAALLAARGFDVLAFDVAPTAVAWARRRFGASGAQFRVLDVLALPAELIGGFDLVVEIRTVPYLPGVVREAAMDAIGRLVAERGVLVAVTVLATDPTSSPGGPPWPQAPSELAAYGASGLVRLALEHTSPAGGGEVAARLTWQRPRGVAP